ncbi:HIT family protein [Azonexus sp.]|uniref:HIT family protein n=1 Tax=Azonexus sp. TaxID=1872668 RepID=UPI0035B48874
MASACVLCSEPGGRLLWQSAHCRVVRVDEPALPGFCRVIWNHHVAEMTDLDVASRQLLMRVVFAVEAAVRQCFSPDKVNLASFGNVVPHLHWHVIPRWRDDRHFPEPIWGRQQRESTPARAIVEDAALTAIITAELAREENRHEQ